MSYLDAVRFVTVGDRAKAMSYASFARKMLYDLTRKGADSGVITARSQRTLPDGTKIEVSVEGMQATARIDVTGGGKVIGKFLMYVMKLNTLCTYDVAAKKQIGAITGVNGYTLGDCTKGGEYVFLYARHGSGVTAWTLRIDVQALTAFGYNYPCNTPSGGGMVAGQAYDFDDAKLSPDETKVLFHFTGSGVDGGYHEGVGGMILADATTLAPLRVPIRMGFLPAPNVWKPDSTRFYMSTTINTDGGDLATNVALQALTESLDEFVSAFDSAGVLVGSRLLRSWGGPVEPDAGWARMIRSMVVSPNGERLYVATIAELLNEGANPPMLYVLDATDDSLPIITTLVLAETAEVSLLMEMGINTVGTRLTLHFEGTDPDSIAEFDISDQDAPVLLHTTASERFNHFETSRDNNDEAFKNGPVHALPPYKAMRFYMTHTSVAGLYTPRALYGFGASFDNEPTYEYDFDGEGVSVEYLLFAERPREVKK